MREEYARKEGQPFKYFYCPILLRDEETELCMGHIIPASLPNCCRARVVQRADVDNFYGSVAEADFGTLIEARERGLHGVVSDHSLRRRLNARILVEGEECRHYTFNGQMAAGHSRITLEHQDGGDIVHLVLAKRPDELIASQGKQWNLVVERDCRISAMMTMVKAAYLTLFRMFGYRYALSASGLSVGRDMLGRFYEENRSKNLSDVRRAACAFFRPYRHMFRPVTECGGNAPRGTIEDNRAGVCFGSSGLPWAVIVWVRVDKDLLAVLMPDVKHPDSAEAYWNFLNNDREEISVSDAVYDAENGRWEVSDKPARAVWPKQGDTFEFE
jgi:hypothetical protein